MLSVTTLLAMRVDSDLTMLLVFMRCVAPWLASEHKMFASTITFKLCMMNPLINLLYIEAYDENTSLW